MTASRQAVAFILVILAALAVSLVSDSPSAQASTLQSANSVLLDSDACGIPPEPGGAASRTSGAPLASDNLCTDFIIPNNYCPTGFPTGCAATPVRSGANFQDPNFGKIDTIFAPPEWFVAPDSAVPDGYLRGKVVSAVNLGVLGGPCTTLLGVPIDFYDASTDVLDTVDWISDGHNTTYHTDLGAPTGKVPVEVAKYPGYLNTIFDLDGGGPKKPLKPYARFYGQVQVATGATHTHLNFVVFSPDQFQEFAGELPANLAFPDSEFGDSAGYLNFVVLNNPTQPTAPSTVTDFCAGLRTKAEFLGSSTTRLNTDLPDICADAIDQDSDGGDGAGPLGTNDGCNTAGKPETGAQCDNAIDDDAADDIASDFGVGRVNDGCPALGLGEDEMECLNNLVNGADDDLDGTIDDGCNIKTAAAAVTLLKNPDTNTGILGTGTHMFGAYSQGYRDVDNDDAGSQHDTCALAFSATPGSDTSCLIANNGPPFTNPPCNTGATFSDRDGDCFLNAQDNCPNVWNGDNPNTAEFEGQEDSDVQIGRAAPTDGPRSDGIGAACEAAPAAVGAAESGAQCRDVVQGDGSGEGYDDDGDTVPDDGCGYDNDNDGAVNEDPEDGVDNDGDGLVDEDPFDDFDGNSATADPVSHGRNTADGHGHQDFPRNALCIAEPGDGNDTDADGDPDDDDDGYCDLTETTLGSDKDSAASTPEHQAVDYTVGSAQKTCNDTVNRWDPGSAAVNNDGDGASNASEGDGPDGDSLPDCGGADENESSDGDGAPVISNPQKIAPKTFLVTLPNPPLAGFYNDAEIWFDNKLDDVTNTGGWDTSQIGSHAPVGGGAANTSGECAANTHDSQPAHDTSGDNYLKLSGSLAPQGVFTVTTCADPIELKVAHSHWTLNSVRLAPISDNCPDVHNAEQLNTDDYLNANGATIGGVPIAADAQGDDCDTDDDNDGFTDKVEWYMGTNAKDNCPKSTGPGSNGDSWGLDINADSSANVIDVLLYKGKIPSAVDTKGERRLDLNADGTNNVIDVLLYKGKIPAACN